MLIKGARVIDPYNKTDDVLDIRTKDGSIAEVKKDIPPFDGEDVIDAAHLVAVPGLVDVHAHFRDPGQTARTGQAPVDMELLKLKGAIGFTDDGAPVMDETLVRQVMLEAARLHTVLSFHEEDPRYVWEAGVNSGRVSESMGLKGADRRAEYIMVERDLRMALETGARIDIQHVSAKESVDIIRKYKAKDTRGLIHAEATPHHFSLTEEAVREKGTLAKVNPPLRTEEDRQALIKGIADGTLDLIATDHAPHTADDKAKDFTGAPSGMIGLETALALGITNLVDAGYITLIKLIELMSTNPAGLYGLKAGKLSVGSPADIVIFDPYEEWTVSEQDIHSLSKNSPFIGKTLHGRVKYTICESKTHEAADS